MLGFGFAMCKLLYWIVYFAQLHDFIHIIYRSRQYIFLRHKIHRELLWISTSAIVWTRHYVVRTGWICHQCRTWRHRICPSGRGNPHIAHWHFAIHPTTNISTMQFLMILISFSCQIMKQVTKEKTRNN